MFWALPDTVRHKLQSIQALAGIAAKYDVGRLTIVRVPTHVRDVVPSAKIAEHRRPTTQLVILRALLIPLPQGHAAHEGLAGDKEVLGQSDQSVNVCEVGCELLKEC